MSQVPQPTLADIEAMIASGEIPTDDVGFAQAALLLLNAIRAGGGGGSGITQLTGDVTAGPGSGSQAATVAKINGVIITNTPTVGQVLIATDATHAAWTTPPASGIQSVVSGSNITVDNTDPANPVVNMPLPIQLSGTDPVAIVKSGGGATIIQFDGQGGALANTGGNASFGFDGGGNPKIAGPTIQGDGTITPVTSITLTGGITVAIS